MHNLLVLIFLAAFAFGKGIVERQLPSTANKQCGNMMCVSATLNGTNIEYALTSLGAAAVGWMGIGFGSQMTNTPMVIIWPNADGSVTLSQRSTPQHVMPTVDPNPPRTASLIQKLTIATGSKPTFVFSVPADNQTGTQSIIYGFSNTTVNSSSEDAIIAPHIDKGVLQLNLAQALPSSATTTTTASAPTAKSNASRDAAAVTPLGLLLLACLWSLY